MLYFILCLALVLPAASGCAGGPKSIPHGRDFTVGLLSDFKKFVDEHTARIAPIEKEWNLVYWSTGRPPRPAMSRPTRRWPRWRSSCASSTPIPGITTSSSWSGTRA